MVLPELNSWGFRLLGGRAGKLALRPLWDKNPAVLWIIKGFSGPSGEGSGDSWVPGCQWTSYPGSAGNPGACTRGANSRNTDTQSEEGGNRLLSTLQPLSSTSQGQKSRKCNLQVPGPAPADHG